MEQSAIDVSEIPYQRFGIPKLGFRNYWYPVVLSSRVGAKPVAVKVLGEDVVLFRDAGILHALADRCPHRGVRLSKGNCQFPGSRTITCPYHGWTFSGADGKLIASLMEGPGASRVGKVSIKSYPVAERCGLVFVFVGDTEAVPIENDLPAFMADPAQFFSLCAVEEYRANWRLLTDNWPYDHHAAFVHRNSPELRFQPMLPFARNVITDEIEGGKGLRVMATGGVKGADYPGLGHFPQDDHLRRLKPTGRGSMVMHKDSKAFKVYGIKSLVEMLLPSIIVIGRPSGEYCLIQWATPIDENRTLLFNINNFRRHGKLLEMRDRVHYYIWRRWAHDVLFSGQDKAIIEATVPGPESLARTDIGVVAWRKFAGANARRANFSVSAPDLAAIDRASSPPESVRASA